MIDEEGGRTRRAFVATGATIGGAVLAGCTSGSERESSDAGDGEDGTGGGNETDDRNGADESYAVTMEPMGAVEFEGPPDRWMALLPSYADMGVALGAGQSLGIQSPERYATHFYEEIPGLEYDPDDVLTLDQNGVDAEAFYEMGAEVHFVEPNQLIQWYDWDESDVEEIETEVGPFFGNFIRRRSDDWHDYPYYSLYQAFEKVAAVFREREKFEAFRELHDETIEGIESRLPTESERPEAMLLYPADEPPAEFYPYRLYEGGVGKKQWRDVGLHDAFADSDVGHYAGDTSLSIDFETMVEIDPDVLLVRGQEGKTDDEFEATIVDHLANDPVASEVTAVRDRAIYRGGYLDQGPIVNLFQTELAARRVYPDEFGDEELFDRDRVGDIVGGEGGS